MPKHEMEILDISGHTTRSWDDTDEAEVAVARRLFANFTSNGYRAFSTKDGAGGSTRHSTPISTFDPHEESVLLIAPIHAG